MNRLSELNEMLCERLGEGEEGLDEWRVGREGERERLKRENQSLQNQVCMTCLCLVIDTCMTYDDVAGFGHVLYSGTSLIHPLLERNTCLIRTTLKSPGIYTTSYCYSEISLI